jgi:hypothetical protein
MMSVLTFPMSIAVAKGQIFLSYLSFCVSLLLVIALLAVLSETAALNVYNSRGRDRTAHPA